MGFLLEPNGTQAICWTERTPKAGAINPRLFSCPLFCDLFHTIVLSISVLFQVKLCCFKHICAVLISSEIESSLSVLTGKIFVLFLPRLGCRDIFWNWEQPFCCDLRNPLLLWFGLCWFHLLCHMGGFVRGWIAARYGSRNSIYFHMWWLAVYR